uniref:Uncharacterized protein n=1 Tax=Encephalitozoon cuniculi TaxID=6035 RepID=M1K222_ENCCN|nr:hypothetical protein ECU11_0900 [Encephalitozoon cuniculi]
MEDKGEDSRRSTKKASVWDEDRNASRGNVSRWEVTPRTATQSKRLKWDQTPLGYIRVEDDLWSGTRMDPGAIWDMEYRDSMRSAEYSEMSLREINMCLPARGYKRYDFHGYAGNGELSVEDLPDVADDEKDFFMPLLEDRGGDEVDVYRGILLVKNGGKRMRMEGLRILRKKEVNRVLEKVLLMAMSLELDDKGKEKVVGLLLSLLDGVDMGKVRYVKEILFVVGSYSYFPSLKRMCMPVLTLVYRCGFGFSVSSIEGDFTSKEPYVREVVGSVVGTFIDHFRMEEVNSLLESLAGSRSSEGRRTCIRCATKICEFSGRSRMSYVGPVLKILSKLVKDRSRFIRIDAANAMSYVFKLVGPLRTGQMDEIFCLLKEEASQSGSIEFVSLLNAMSYLCHDSREHSEVVFSLLKTSKEKGIPDLKVFERICDKVGTDDAWKYFDQVSCILFSPKGRESAGLASSICAKMGSDPRVSRKILEYYSDPPNAGLASRIFSRIPRLGFGESEVERYYRSICNALAHDDTTVGLVLPLVSKEFLGQKHTSMLISESLKLLRSPPPDARIRGLKTMGSLAKILSTKELAYCGNILMENIDGDDQETLPFVLKAICSIYNSHRFRPASGIIPSILPILKSKEQKIVTSGVALLHTICMNSPEECEKIGVREWMRISYGLVDSLVSWNKEMRRNATESLGCISRIVGPQEILDILMDGLESEDRHQRTGSSLGISVVGEYNGLFSVLPTLLSDYETPNAFVQQGILRAMCHFFQRTHQASLKYVHSMLPMIEDAMTDEDPSYRSLGMNLIRHIVLNHPPATMDIELAIHLLNLIWANILDPIPTVQQSFDECMESFATVLSSQAMYKYVQQGLFHPSSTVRKRYCTVLEIMEHFDSTTLSQCLSVEEELPELAR